MFFINALYLLAATAVAGPVLFHLLLRDRPKRQVLPTARFLTDSAPQSYAMHRLKNLLLLILRTAVVALLVLAFARPFFGKAPTTESTATAEAGAVFAVDASLSMSAADRWRAATGRVKTLASALPDRSPVALLLFNKNADLVAGPTTDQSVVLAELQRHKPTSVAGDLTAAIQAASDLAAGLDAKRKIVYLISDFQDSAVVTATRAGMQPGVEVVPVQVDDETHPNAAIVTAGLTRNQTSDKGDVVIGVHNFGTGTLNSNVVVSRDGERVATVPVSAESMQRASITATIDLPAANESRIELQLESSDAIVEDNQYRFVAEVPTAVPVLVLERTGAITFSTEGKALVPAGANAYLSAALTAMDNAVAASWLDPERITTEGLNGFPVVILSSASITARQIELLQSYVNLGGSLIIFPQQDQTVGLAELSGAAFDGWDRVPGTGEDYRLVSATLAQGPFALLDQSAQTVLGHPRAVKFLKCSAELPPDVTALAKFDDGSPFLFERKHGDGLVYLFSVALDASSTDFVLRAAFAPFLDELIAHAADQVKIKRNFTTADHIPRRMAAAQGNPSSLVEPGFVSFATGKNPLTVAVNVDPIESNLTPADAERVRSFAAQAGTVARPDSAIAANLLEPEKERDHESPIWKYFLMGALVLLAAESLLASRTTR